MIYQKLNELLEDFGRGGQRRLAEYLEETPTNINRYAKGKREIPNSLIPKIAEFFGVIEQDFFPNSQQQKQKIIDEELENPSEQTIEKMNKYCGSNNFLGGNNFVGNGSVKNGVITHNNTPQELLTAKEQVLLDFYRESTQKVQKELFNYITS